MAWSGCATQGPYLAGYTAVEGAPPNSYGLRRLDHAVGNVPVMDEAVRYIKAATGFHEFAEFTAEARAPLAACPCLLSLTRCFAAPLQHEDHAAAPCHPKHLLASCESGGAVRGWAGAMRVLPLPTMRFTPMTPHGL